MKKLLFILTISAIFIACPASKNDSVCHRYYWHNFDIPVHFDPPDSVLHIGDTITVTSQFPNKLWDRDSIDQFIFDSINFHVACGIGKIDTFGNSKASESTFDLFNILIDSSKYNYQKAHISFSLDLIYDGDEYYLQFKIVPKYKGVFYFEFFSIIGSDFIDSQKIYAVNGECKTEYWDPWLITNNGIGNNKEFLKLSPLKFYNTTAYNDWYKHNHIDGTHLFKVE